MVMNVRNRLNALVCTIIVLFNCRLNVSYVSQRVSKEDCWVNSFYKRRNYTECELCDKNEHEATYLSLDKLGTKFHVASIARFVKTNSACFLELCHSIMNIRKVDTSFTLHLRKLDYPSYSDSSQSNDIVGRHEQYGFQLLVYSNNTRREGSHHGVVIYWSCEQSDTNHTLPNLHESQANSSVSFSVEGICLCKNNNASDHNSTGSWMRDFIYIPVGIGGALLLCITGFCISSHRQRGGPASGRCRTNEVEPIRPGSSSSSSSSYHTAPSEPEADD